MSDVRLVAAHSLQAAAHGRTPVVIGAFCLGYLVLFGLGADAVIDAAPAVDDGIAIPEGPIRETALAGIGSFLALFAGVVSAALIALNAVRGDAERGLLQPVVARPVGRTALLLGRFLAAAVVGVAVAAALCVGSAALIELAGGDAPSRWPAATASVCLGVTVVAALALAGSTLLSTTGNGIAVFLLFGAGLVAGLLAQLGEVVDSSRLREAGDVVAWALPFEALHQHALAELGHARGGLRIVLQLGPFGGADAAGWGLFAFTAAYVGAALTLAAVRFRNMEL